jgi:aminocarboxymuconate-semialdehyde decarboxylase
LSHQNISLKIDVQCHIFPRSFIRELERSDNALIVNPPGANGRRVIVDPRNGDEVTFFVENSAYVDPEMHLKDMTQFGIDRQILSLPPPSVDKFPDPKEALRLSGLVNDEIASIVQKYPNKFLGFATIPMNDPALAISEINRSITKLGLKGIIISSNTRGKFYDDEIYADLFSAVEKLNVPIFIHPTEPITGKLIGQDYKLSLIFGWPFDTTLCGARLVFSGVLRRHPNLKIILAHGGGMIPFFAGRIDMLAKIAAGGGKRIELEDPAREFKKLYFDAALFDSDSLDLLAKFCGADHIVYASDYPFGQNLGKNCYESSLSMMTESKLNWDSKNRIFGGNISDMLGISSA